ncbi:MAG: hypothetical protein K0S02_3222 [Achromobacter mucicolens]|jgi:hypothetical protein|nr:hypothetical protein [Achromobacter mucicolens]
MPRAVCGILQDGGPAAARSNLNTSCKKPYTGFLLYDNAIYSNIRV